MSFQLSPGVRTREIDLTNAIPAVATSIGAYAGEFRWGPVNQPVVISDEKRLALRFGTPTKDEKIQKHFFTAASFLNYANFLYVVRAERDDMLNASSNSAPTKILNQDDFDTKTGLTDVIYAKYPGTIANDLSVLIVGSDRTDLSSEEEETANSVLSIELESDEVSVIIIDATGKITGRENEVLEVFEALSIESDAKTESGANNFVVDVINQDSLYIWLNDISDWSDTSGTLSESYTLTGGSNGTDTLKLIDAYQEFANGDEIDVNLVIGGETPDDGALSAALVQLVESRRDAMLFLSPPVEASINKTDVSDVLNWRNNIGVNSSFVSLDSSALYIYDRYNDEFVYIPASGHVAGLCANTDNVADAWFSPAGYNRGRLLGVTRVAHNPTKTERDQLYVKSINPIVSFAGEGIILFGDKTSLTRESAFSRINVRRLFIVLEKAIATAAKFQLFEFNDEFTRAMFLNMVEPFLRDIQGRRGITDFRVVCDETNNTPQVIDTNNFVADMYIAPARSINFIQLNFIATRTGVEFSEIIGLRQ